MNDLFIKFPWSSILIQLQNYIPISKWGENVSRCFSGMGKEGLWLGGWVGASRPRVGRKARRRAWLSQCGNTRQLGGRYRARPHLPQIPTTLGALRPRKSASAPLSVFCQILNCWFLLAPVVNECTVGPAMRAVKRLFVRALTSAAQCARVNTTFRTARF